MKIGNNQEITDELIEEYNRFIETRALMEKHFLYKYTVQIPGEPKSREVTYGNSLINIIHLTKEGYIQDVVILEEDI